MTAFGRYAAALAVGVLVLALGAGGARAVELPQNDYPTDARADYVFACMQVNGQTRDALRRCSCSVDVIASLMAFADYEEAETILSVRQKGGESTDMFFSTRRCARRSTRCGVPRWKPSCAVSEPRRCQAQVASGQVASGQVASGQVTMGRGLLTTRAAISAPLSCASLVRRVASRVRSRWLRLER